ncbi:MAG: hypothetical protein R3D71_07760 [Rickettsiales bacterium]
MGKQTDKSINEIRQQGKEGKSRINTKADEVIADIREGHRDKMAGISTAGFIGQMEKKSSIIDTVAKDNNSLVGTKTVGATVRAYGDIIGCNNEVLPTNGKNTERVISERIGRALRKGMDEMSKSR